MMIRYLGALLVIAGAAGVGLYLSNSIRQEISAMQQSQKALDYLIYNLGCKLTPLPELCSDAGRRTKGAVSAFFSSFSEALEKNTAPEAYSCGEYVLRKMEAIPESTRDILLELVQIVGTFDLEGTVTLLHGLRDKTERWLMQNQKERASRTRSYQTLVLCAGAALAVLLL